jgi:hypothetical protein
VMSRSSCSAEGASTVPRVAVRQTTRFQRVLWSREATTEMPCCLISVSRHRGCVKRDGASARGNFTHRCGNSALTGSHP